MGLADWYRKFDARYGGILPGGGTPIQPAILNKLPPNINLGYRYITGTGNRDLELPEDFKREAIRLAIRDSPIPVGGVRSVQPYQQEYRTPILDTIPTALGLPVLGDKDPAAAPYRYSLGRYNVANEGDRYTIRDENYDLRNEFESPSMQKKAYDPATGQWQKREERNIPEGIARGIVGLIDPSEFLRAFINLRKTEPRPYGIEFSVPTEYGTGFGP